jgi:predicted nuclease of predicted toxin-antitoxin system
MRLLLDECMPTRLKRHLGEHETLTINEAGLKGLKNGKLLRSAGQDFDVLITVDKNIEYQQNKLTLPIAVLILSARSNRYELLLPLMPKALEVINAIKAGEIITVR